MRKSFVFILMIIAAIEATAQSETRFITSGKIEFERKMNVHRLFFSGEEDSWNEMMKKAIPQFRTDFFDLSFTETKSVYRPGKNSEVPKAMGWRNPPGMENIVYKDLENEVTASQKLVFEDIFLLNDSLQKIEWKIQSETREIAGFECRKAIARICDSVVVVAFYTEEIVPSAGPESFHGLPGMILGLAVPRLYTTWFATKVEILSSADEKKIAPPTKGKKLSQKELLSNVHEATKDWWWDKGRDKNLWLSTL